MPCPRKFGGGQIGGSARRAQGAQLSPLGAGLPPTGAEVGLRVRQRGFEPLQQAQMIPQFVEKHGYNSRGAPGKWPAGGRETSGALSVHPHTVLMSISFRHLSMAFSTCICRLIW